MMRFRKAFIASIAALVAAAALAVWAEGLRAGAKAPDFTLKDTQGRTFKLSAFKGKPVFINFFATWCGPCRVEFPEVVKLHREMNEKGVKIISVSVDAEPTRNRVKPFADQYNARHQVLLGESAMDIADNYAVEGIPSNYLIGKDGKVRNNWVGFSGPRDAQAWKAAIEAELKKK